VNALQVLSRFLTTPALSPLARCALTGNCLSGAGWRLEGVAVNDPASFQAGPVGSMDPADAGYELSALVTGAS
jgi:hypothetical protein